MELFIDVKLYLVRVSSNDLKDREEFEDLKIFQGEANNQLSKM